MRAALICLSSSTTSSVVTIGAAWRAGTRRVRPDAETGCGSGMVWVPNTSRRWPRKFSDLFVPFMRVPQATMRILMVRAILLILLFGNVSPAFAQSASTGGLSGTVADSSGRGIPNVTVSLTQSVTRQTRTTASGEDGSFGFSLLAPGDYEVEFQAPGFKTARLSQVVVDVSEVPALEAVLEAGDSSEPVECQCRLSVATSATGTLIDAKTITAVPLTTRNLTQVLSMSFGLRRRRQQRRNARPRHAQRQRQRQHQRGELYARRSLRPQRGSQPRHHFRAQGANVPVRCRLRRAGAQQHDSHHQERRERVSRQRCGSSCATTCSTPTRSSATPPGSPSRT